MTLHCRSPLRNTEATNALCAAPAYQAGDNGFEASMLGDVDTEVSYLDHLLAQPESTDAATRQRPKTPFYGAAGGRTADGGFQGKAFVGIDERDPRNGIGVRVMNASGEFEADASGATQAASAYATAWEFSADPAKAKEPTSGPWGGVRFGDAGITADFTGDTREFGYRADAASAELGFRESNKDRRSDRALRAGPSLGLPNLAFRIQAEDRDKDGHPEYGVGGSFPVGPVGVSIERTSETPIGDGAIELLDAFTTTLNLPVSATRMNDMAATVVGRDNAPSTRIDDAVRGWWNGGGQ